MAAPKPSTAQAIREILVPLDGSSSANAALQTALDVASIYHARLIMVSVVSSPGVLTVGTEASPADLSDYYEKAREDAQRTIDAALKIARDEGVEARGEVLQGPGSTADEIVEMASKEEVGLIVMGTRGLGGLKKLVLGSVSSAVLSEAHCSVLVVR